MPTISFSVSYTLREYLSFVRDHLPVGIALLAPEGKKKRAPSKAVYPFVLAFAAVVFFFKKRAMPVCDFVIDDKEIRRTTRGGTLVVPWSDLIAVRRYSQGYLIDKGSKGAMPLPYRCFSPEQALMMEGFIQAFDAELLIK
jgi:YcxB-like protein